MIRVTYGIRATYPQVIHFEVMCCECGRLFTALMHVANDKASIPVVLQCKNCNTEICISDIDPNFKPVSH